jgi:hypothetical protein
MALEFCALLLIALIVFWGGGDQSGTTDMIHYLTALASTDVSSKLKEAHLPLPGIPFPFLFQHLGQR